MRSTPTRLVIKAGATLTQHADDEQRVAGEPADRGGRAGGGGGRRRSTSAAAATPVQTTYPGTALPGERLGGQPPGRGRRARPAGGRDLRQRVHAAGERCGRLLRQRQQWRRRGANHGGPGADRRRDPRQRYELVPRGGGRLGVGEGGRAVGRREHRGQGRQLDELRRSLGWRRRDRGGLHDAGAVRRRWSTTSTRRVVPTHTTGGAGTVYVRGGGQSYGRLVVDNGTVTGNKRTVLPSLGSGTAGSGSGGATLVTGRSKVIPPYFVGHWVEIRNGAGVLEGTWRIALDRRRRQDGDAGCQRQRAGHGGRRRQVAGRLPLRRVHGARLTCR